MSDYGILHTSMYTGSMVGSGSMAFALMDYCIAMAKQEEDCSLDLNPPILAVIFGEPVNKVEEAITFLSSPDKRSRRREMEGRRIVHIGPGPYRYKVVNLMFYRSTAKSNDRRAYWRQYREWERKGRKGDFVFTPVHSEQSARTVSHSDVQGVDVDVDVDVHVPPNGGTLSESSSGKEKKLPPEAERWNEICGCISKVVHMSTDRMKHLVARRKDPFWSLNFEEALQKIRASSFCNGINERGWKASFDWLIKQPSALAKVIEGKYDRTTTHQKHPAKGFDRNAGTLNEGRASTYSLQKAEAAKSLRDAKRPAA